MQINVYFLSALVGVLAGVFALMEILSRRSKNLIMVTVQQALEPFAGRLYVLETKMELFWRSVAIDSAKILHQPDARRSHIDKLLEALMADKLTEQGEAELRGYLVKIRNWEPGVDVGFPVHPGEQTAAAILLATMNHVLTRKTGGTSD